MGRGHVAFITVILFLFMSVTTSNGHGIVEDHGPAFLSRKSNTPILIGSDQDFEYQADSYGWEGNGSIGDPFVIKDMAIDGSGSDHGIAIHNTAYHFRIENCTISGTDQTSAPYWGSGAFFFDVSGELIDCTIRNNTIGIFIQGCNNLTFRDCDLLDNGDGTDIRDSQDISVSGNQLEGGGNGIDCRNSRRVDIKGNRINGTATNAIFLDGVRGSSIEDNHAQWGDCSMWLYYSDSNVIRNNTNINNDDHAIRLTHSSHNTVERNHAEKNDVGVHLDLGSDHNRISNNSIGQCGDHGMYLEGSRWNKIEHNKFHLSNIFIANDLETMRDQYISNSNTIDEKPVYHYNGSHHDGTEVPIDVGQVIACGVSNLTVRGAELPEGTVGIKAWECDHLRIYDSIIHNQHYYGIWASDCSGMMIDSTYIESALNGFDISRCSGAGITNCGLRSGKANIIQSPNVEVKDSSFTGSDIAVEIQDSPDCEISKCLFEDILDNGVYIYSSGCNISNCTFNNVSTGIRSSTGSGGALITGSDFISCHYGVYLDHSNVNRITNSSFQQCNISIRGWRTEGNIIDRNTIMRNDPYRNRYEQYGILLYYSRFNVIEQNHVLNIPKGIGLYHSDNNTMAKNDLHGSLIDIAGSPFTFESQNITRDNLVDRRSVLYIVSGKGLNLTKHSEPGELIMAGMEGVNISDLGNERTGWTCPMIIAYSSLVNITNCSFSNTPWGISIITSQDVEVRRCVFNGTRKGLSAYHCSDIGVKGSRFRSCSDQGISFSYCSSGNISGSYFVEVEGRAVYLFGCLGFNVTSSHFREGQQDITLDVSNGNNITGNLFFDTVQSSIYLSWSRHNLISDNAFTASTFEEKWENGSCHFVVCDHGPNTIERNYWNTWSEPMETDILYLEEPVNISGSAGVRDMLPLTRVPRSILPEPTEFISSLVNRSIIEIAWGRPSHTVPLMDLVSNLFILDNGTGELVGNFELPGSTNRLRTEIEGRELFFIYRSEVYNRTSYASTSPFPGSGEPPKITCELDIDGKAINWTSILVSWSAASNTSRNLTHYYSLDGAHWTLVPEPRFNLTGEHEEYFTFWIMSMGEQGRTDKKRFDIYWDNVGPGFELIDPKEGALLPGNFTVSWLLTRSEPEPLDMIWTLDGETWKEGMGSSRSRDLELSTGRHQLEMTVRDKALNTCSRSVNIVVDADPPGFSISKRLISKDPLKYTILVFFDEEIRRDRTEVLVLEVNGTLNWTGPRTLEYLPEKELLPGQRIEVFVSTEDLVGNRAEGWCSTSVPGREPGGTLIFFVRTPGIEERTMGELLIDGERHNISSLKTVEIPLEPGIYSLTLLFHGFEPLELEVVIWSGEGLDLGTIDLIPVRENGEKDNYMTLLIVLSSIGALLLLAAFVSAVRRGEEIEE